MALVKAEEKAHVLLVKIPSWGKKKKRKKSPGICEEPC